MYTKRPLELPQVREASGLFLSPSDYAKASGLSLSTVWRRLRAREIPSVKRAGKRLIPADAVVAQAAQRVFDEQHPMWRLVGSAKSGGAGPGSSDKHRYLADEAAGRR